MPPEAADPNASPAGSPPSGPATPPTPAAPPAPAGGAPQPNNDAQLLEYKRAAEKAQRELDALKKAQLTDAERVKLERDEFEKKAKDQEARANNAILQARFEAAAVKAGCHDPEAAFSLADRSLIEVGSDGKVIGLDRTLDALKKAKPYLFGPVKPPSLGSGGGNPGTPPPESANGRMNSWIRKLAGYT